MARAARIAHHRQQRPTHWRLREEPLALAAVLREEAAAQRCLLVDCLTLWLTNLLLAEDSQALARERLALLDCLEQLPGLLAPKDTVEQGGAARVVEQLARYLP